MSEENKRTAQSIIAEAIRENGLGEQMLYFFSGATFVIGTIVLGVGVYRSEGVTSIVGAVFGSFFYPAMRNAKAIRDQNLAIRLLEIPLADAKTSKEAASILNDFFTSTISKPSRSVNKGSPKS